MGNAYWGKLAASLGRVFVSALGILAMAIPLSMGWQGRVLAQTALPTFQCTNDLYMSYAPDRGEPPMHLARFNTKEIAVDGGIVPFHDLVEPDPESTLIYNALAFNPADNYLYAMKHLSNVLLRIGSNGVSEEVGPISGLPSGETYNAGIIAPVADGGGYYVKPTRNNFADVIFRIDIGNLSAEKIQLNDGIDVQDLVWQDHKIYTITGSNGRANILYSIDINLANHTGSLIDRGDLQIDGGPVTFGALFFGEDGKFFYGTSNNPGHLYQIFTGNPKYFVRGQTPQALTNDGANCPGAVAVFLADLEIQKTDHSDTYVAGENVVYEIVVKNNGPSGTPGVSVSDPLPPGISASDASWVCKGDGDGDDDPSPEVGVCQQKSGSGAIDNVLVDLPVNRSVTFTLTLSVPANFSGELKNTATVTPPSDTEDTKPDNNTSTDSDVRVVVSKSVDVGNGTAVMPGQLLQYTLTATVEGPAGGAITTPQQFTDTLGDGLTLVPNSLQATDGSCEVSGQVLTCTLAAGATVGSHTFTYNARVDQNATVKVGNTVAGLPCDNSDPALVCTTSNPISTVTVHKTASVGGNPLASGTPVAAGQQLDYTLHVSVADTATTTDTVLTDTLSDGLTLVAGSLSSGCSVSGQTLTCTLAAGAAPGEHTFTYSATVNQDAITSVNNQVAGAPCDASGTCTITNPLNPKVTVSKSVDVGNGTTVNAGDTLGYTLSVQVTNAATDRVTTLTDTLGNGLTLVADSLPADCSVTGQVVKCTLASGTEPGTYTFAYSATVDTDAKTQVGNSVVTDNGSCTDAESCTTSNPISTATVHKTASVGGNPLASGTPVTAGQQLDYTLHVSVAGAPTTTDTVLTDTLSDGLTLLAGSLPSDCSVAGQKLTCTLATGAAVGEHTFTYSATVNQDATTSVNNQVAGVPCDASGTCTIINPLNPKVTVSKEVDVGNGTTVHAGDTLGYTLNVIVTDAATDRVTTLTDTLGDGLTLVSDSLPTDCSATGQVVICTLASGTVPGTYTFAYRATVDADATTQVGNSVETDNGGCVAANACTTSNPLNSGVTVSKTVDVGNGTAVKAGDTLGYTLSVVVVDAATDKTTTLTDTLGNGLTVDTDSLPADCSATGQVVTCTLASGTVPGTYPFAYRATVDADAMTQVGNSVETDNGGCVAANACTTSNPLNSGVTVSKTVDVGNGTAVKAGDTLGYTLSVVVVDAATDKTTTLTDTLGNGLTMDTDSLPADCSATGQVVTCTLASGTVPGTYTFAYRATVDTDATTQVGNSVETDNGGCVAANACTTSNPLNSQVTVSKTVDVGNGTAVKAGDTLGYTLNVIVTDAATDRVTTLTDTLGNGLTLVSDSLPTDCSATGQVVICTLASGTVPGTYTFAYRATVDADATTQVGNSVETDNGGCVAANACTTSNPLNSKLTVSKSVDVGNGTAVKAGDTLGYTLSVTVVDAATDRVTTLTDTLGNGLTLVSDSLPTDCSATGQVVTCTLASGTVPGTYTFAYRATVDTDATTQVGNSVETDNGGCVAANACTTSNPLNSGVTVSKTVDVGNGTAVKAGDTLGYTLSVVVVDAATDKTTTLTDTLGNGLTMDTDSLPADCSATGQVVTCTLASGTVPGTYTFAYRATVDTDATTQVGNSVETDNGGCVAANACTTSNPLNSQVTVSKSVDVGNGTAVKAGDTLGYTLNVIVVDAATDKTTTLTDTLGNGLTVVANSLPASCSVAGQVVTCTLASGSEPGTYTFAYKATVDADATTQVGNSVATDNGGCVAANACTTSNPLNSKLTVSKSVDVGNGTAVKAGDTLGYTLSVTVVDAATDKTTTLTDTLGNGLTVVANSLPASCSVAGQVVTCKLASGSEPGTYTFAYKATVDTDATTQVGNSVETDNGGCVAANACTTSNPLNSGVTVSKSVDVGNGTAVKAGDTLGYTLSVIVTDAATDRVTTLTDTLGNGLTLVSDSLPTDCSATGQVVTCTLASRTVPGTYTFAYRATVDADATTQVGNSVETDNGGCVAANACTTSNPLNSKVTVSKAVGVGNGTEVKIGDTLDYMLSVAVADAATDRVTTLTDTLGVGLTVVPGSLPTGCSAVGQVVTCTLASGSAPGTYTFAYSATVNADATTQVGNSVVTDNGGCVAANACTTSNPLDANVTVSKSVSVGNGTAVKAGDTLSYALHVVVAGGPTDRTTTLVDTLGDGLSLVAASAPTACSVAGQVMTCTLPPETAPGTYTFSYRATVDADATTQVGNSVVTDNGGCAAANACTTSNPLDSKVAVSKTVDVGNGTTVKAGDTLGYALHVVVADAATDRKTTLTDTLGDGLTLAADSLPDGCTSAGQVVTCTLAAKTVPGTYTFAYRATVSTDAITQADNRVVTDNGSCATAGACVTSNPLNAKVSVSKSVDVGNGTAVNAGDTLGYTLSAVVTDGATSQATTLTDTLGHGLTLVASSLPAGCAATEQKVTCTLAAATVPGTYTFAYRATVDADAVTQVDNRVAVDHGTCEDCSTSNPLLPKVSISKTADPKDGSTVVIGQTITYTVAATVSDASTTEPLTLSDTLSDGQTLLTNSIAAPAGGRCDVVANGLECSLAPGAAIGTHVFTYQAQVSENALTRIGNAVTAAGGGGNAPDCAPCSTTHKVDTQQLRITKSVAIPNVHVGDLVRYTLTVENVGAVDVTDDVLVDTPPPGFSYVEGSLSVNDGDGAFDLAPGRYPLQISGLDVAAGKKATIVYMLRVGAGVRHGVHINSAQAHNQAGDPVSNVATAQVTVEAGPLLDDSLIYGTVFDDRDSDGWQDSAKLTGIQVHGGFAPDAYVERSTTIGRSEGSESPSETSASLLDGIAIGAIAARQSEADPTEAHQVVISQRLTKLAFTDDFVLTDDQGVTVRMDAEGQTTVERSGEAGKGRNGAAPTVERRIVQGENGLTVEYVIGNAGIDERGVPGVRIASVEGLQIETDQFGRYHLVDVPGGERGYRNFILKVDPSTLPPETEFTTDNPLVRRITPGIPVRFDFGVRLPVKVIPGGSKAVSIALGEVIFAPRSAEVRPEYMPAIAKMAEKVDTYRGGEVVITADGESQALAFDRAAAIRDLLVARVAPEHTKALKVEVHTVVKDQLVAGATDGGMLLGTVLFDTDRSEIRPEFEPLLDRVAALLEASGGGLVGVVGHTDVRASYEYNIALGMRRARAVYQALTKRLSPEVRARVHVDFNNDPTAPVGGPVRK